MIWRKSVFFFYILALIIVALLCCKNIMKMFSENSQKESYEDTFGHNVNFMAANVNRSIADVLYNNIRILCCVSVSNHRIIKFIKYSWGKRCHKILFIGLSDGSDDWDVIKLPRHSKQMFKYVYKHHIQYADWFLWTIDNTYVIMENLRYLLYPYNPQTPLQFGCPYKSDILNKSASIVLSKAALKLLVKSAFPDPMRCSLNNHTFYERDLGICLRNVGVKIGDSHDNPNFLRLFSMGLNEHFNELESNHLPIIDKDCCSLYMVFFWVQYAEYMYSFEMLIYRIHRYGINQVHPKLPEKFSNQIKINS